MLGQTPYFRGCLGNDRVGWLRKLGAVAAIPPHFGNASAKIALNLASFESAEWRKSTPLNQFGGAAKKSKKKG
jgi:hypothetical protein